MATRKFISKENNLNPETYIGAKGELWVSDEDGSLRLGDGSSPGGTDISSGGSGNGTEIARGDSFASVENDGNINISIDGRVVAVSNGGGKLAYYNTDENEWQYVHDNSPVV